MTTELSFGSTSRPDGAPAPTEQLFDQIGVPSDVSFATNAPGGIGPNPKSSTPPLKLLPRMSTSPLVSTATDVMDWLPPTPKDLAHTGLPSTSSLATNASRTVARSVSLPNVIPLLKEPTT